MAILEKIGIRRRREAKPVQGLTQVVVSDPNVQLYGNGGDGGLVPINFRQPDILAAEVAARTRILDELPKSGLSSAQIEAERRKHIGVLDGIANTLGQQRIAMGMPVGAERIEVQRAEALAYYRQQGRQAREIHGPGSLVHNFRQGWRLGRQPRSIRKIR